MKIRFILVAAVALFCGWKILENSREKAREREQKAAVEKLKAVAKEASQLQAAGATEEDERKRRERLKELGLRTEKLMKEAQSSADGAEAKMMAVSSTVMGPIFAQIRKLDEVAGRNVDDIFEIGKITPTTDLASRRKYARELMTEAKKFLTLVNGVQAAFSKGLDAAGLKGRELAKYVDYFEKKSQPMVEHHSALWRPEVTKVESVLRVYDLLDSERGKWRVSAGDIVFGNQAAIDNFNQCVRTINLANKEQAAARAAQVERAARGR